MDIKEKQTRGFLVKQTTETAGWGIILEEISFAMNKAKDKLLTTDPEDTIKISKLQERYKALERLINNIIEITKEV